jgi:hypothetical protein
VGRCRPAIGRYRIVHLSPFGGDLFGPGADTAGAVGISTSAVTLSAVDRCAVDITTLAEKGKPCAELTRWC